MNPEVAELGRQSGVYREVHVAPAHQVPEPDASFDHVFSNCALEHMDHLDAVLAETHRCLKPDGTLLCSVPTEKLLQWSLLSNFFRLAEFRNVEETLKNDFISYHHFISIFSADEWICRFKQSGLVPITYIPILPRISGSINLLMDALWHVKKADGGEIGEDIYAFLSTISNFSSSFRKIFAGLLDMEPDWNDCGGAVFMVRKPTSGERGNG